MFSGSKRQSSEFAYPNESRLHGQLVSPSVGRDRSQEATGRPNLPISVTFTSRYTPINTSFLSRMFFCGS